MSSAAVDAALGPHETSNKTKTFPPGESKQSFLGLGGKGDEVSPKVASETAPQIPELANVLPTDASTSSSPSTSPAQSPQSPDRSPHSSGSPTLAARSAAAPYVSSTPPRLSASSSQIFERNVQEHSINPNIPVPTSPAILAHLQTEDRVPPVLSASSLAITDRDCDVEDVEIIMHSAHQPAVSGLAPGGSNHSPHGCYYSLDHSEDARHYSSDDLCSHDAGAGVAADKQRLSFISFADVVQAEQSQHFSDAASSPSRGSPVQSVTDPIAISTITETLRKRSSSPIGIGNDPLQAGYTSGEKSPGRSTDNCGIERGELTVETMGEALRKTENGDLGQRSPIGGFDRTL